MTNIFDPAIDRLERETIAGIHAECAHARTEPWFVDASAANRAVLDAAMAEVVARATAMFDALRAKVAGRRLH